MYCFKNINVVFQVFHMDAVNNGPAYQLVQRVKQYQMQKNQLQQARNNSLIKEE